jgi:hypothetical protein
MRMKLGVIPEGMDDHDHPEDAVIEAQHGSKENLQALFGAVAWLGEELSVVLEIDAEHDRNAEDKLSMRDGIENVL